MASVPSLKVRLTAYAVGIVILLALVEGGARLALYLKDQQPWPPVPLNMLDDYEVKDPDRPWLWRLKLGYRKTIRELITEKKATGHVLGAEILERWVREYKMDLDSAALEVNPQGLKGPPLDPLDYPFRILTIGDSCTFGAFIDYFAYPRALERTLRERGLHVEVANGGVEGYSPHHALARIEEFKALKPAVTTIYIGWNALYSTQIEKEFQSSATITLFKRVWNRFVSYWATDKRAYLMVSQTKRADRDAREVRQAAAMDIPFVGDVERIVREMQASGSRVVLLTLPGLYVPEETPSARAMEIGHLPSYTDNPYVLAALADNYNARLRQLSQKTGAELIDLAEWSKTALQPRDKNFFDSVHLELEAQAKLGVFLASELAVKISQ